MAETTLDAKTRYFDELTLQLNAAGFTAPRLSPLNELMVEWQGQPLCKVNGAGNILYRSEDMRLPEIEAAKNQVIHIASTTAEYMASYVNYCHVVPDSKTYLALKEDCAIPVLRTITEAELDADMKELDLSAAATKYLLKIGLSGGEIKTLREVLSRGYYSTPDWGPIEAADRIIARRGASGEEIKHTVAAYDLAVQYGVKLLEQDVVSSKDGTLYVSHDLSAKRITGEDKQYSDMTDEEIDALRTRDGQQILRLSEVFDRYGSTVTYVIELKDGGAQVEQFAALVKKYGNDGDIIVQCFKAEVLEELESIFPEMPKMYLINEQKALEQGLYMDYADILATERKLMSAENCNMVHSAGKQMCVWTIDSEEEIQTAIDIGVDYYFTNYAARAFALEKAAGGEA